MKELTLQQICERAKEYRIGRLRKCFYSISYTSYCTLQGDWINVMKIVSDKNELYKMKWHHWINGKSLMITTDMYGVDVTISDVPRSILNKLDYTGGETI